MAALTINREPNVVLQTPSILSALSFPASAQIILFYATDLPRTKFISRVCEKQFANHGS
jgi:hypothetical protein